MYPKITNEERRKAEKILSGLSWIGDREEHIENIVKNRVRRGEGYFT